MLKMEKEYRRGALGALMDEYERAATELARLVENISAEEYLRVVDPVTADDDCRSVQTIMSHVVRSGYGYADYIREQLSMASDHPEIELLSYIDIFEQLDRMLEYTAQTLESRWEMTTEEIRNVIIKTRSGGTYHLEQMLQHAIVHILRHRRQIDRFIGQRLITISGGV